MDLLALVQENNVSDILPQVNVWPSQTRVLHFRAICMFRDCSGQVKTAQISLLNIIHKLWGNKAIIVLQDAGIDVSGIQLNTDGSVHDGSRVRDYSAGVNLSERSFAHCAQILLMCHRRDVCQRQQESFLKAQIGLSLVSTVTGRRKCSHPS